MSLTETDLQSIRGIFQEEIQAVENDVKELYGMLSGLTAKFSRLKKDMSQLKIDVSWLRNSLMAVARQTNTKLDLD